MKKPPFEVSDHAVLRYLERAMGVDVEGTRRRIGRAVAVAEGHEGITGVLVGGMRFRLRGKIVVTVEPTQWPRQRHGQKKG
ncbi:hypothetical protein RGUI_0821 [Rhodovulum sp. P5]|uniref:hypothetical protein n=1 Tax=Rhodovulum phage vB_RhkS_P1 TaxID=1873452 RepID=UPI00080A9B80|nr:hypothetical protein [Rhodovulum sp. P5]YP_009285906.1 hypothetical protein BI026_gp21 [Rhodovulum phage vB_RhkS_P1]ANT39891.1 hypothetical protein Rhks_21 [Rhodovulum phage vB_RhkS_P1]ARE38962.1 hypothetical protein RGUI_0821 [Rhodovulum sp. P5]